MNFDMSNQNSNGLLRFRSAPSSVLQSFVNDNEKTRDVNDGLNYNFISQTFQDLQEEVDLKPNLITGFSLNSQLTSHYPRQSTSQASMDSTSSYNSGTQLSSSMAMSVDNLGQQSKSGSSLLRQNSSPAGLFSHLNHPHVTGYGGLGGTVASYRLGNVSDNGELIPSSSRLKRQLSSTSGVVSLGMLPRISEIEPENSESGVLNETSDYPFGSWEHEPSQFIDSFTGLKRELDLQNSDNLGNHPPPMLAHHLSLPKTSGEMSAVEKMLHFQDSVPCKIRAKRGCATHPRSIAERVRRTRISERMRKLQELVPHMDKQTNTSDMLDLAVDYIKDLQEQYKALKDCRANCRCSANSGQS